MEQEIIKLIDKYQELQRKEFSNIYESIVKDLIYLLNLYLYEGIQEKNGINYDEEDDAAADDSLPY